MSGLLLPTGKRPMLVGEADRLADPRFALYPDPRGSAGWNLCHKVMGFEAHEYLRRFDRFNLCCGQWNMHEAREAARHILVELQNPVIALFGARVCAAFGITYQPFEWLELGESIVVRFPHPSGMCRVWNQPGAFRKARETMISVGMLPPNAPRTQRARREP